MRLLKTGILSVVFLVTSTVVHAESVGHMMSRGFEFATVQEQHVNHNRALLEERIRSGSLSNTSGSSDSASADSSGIIADGSSVPGMSDQGVNEITIIVIGDDNLVDLTAEQISDIGSSQTIDITTTEQGE